MLWAELVLAGFTRLVVQFATFWICRSVAFGSRHFLLDALAEGWVGLALAFLIYLLARFALLWVARLATIKILHLFSHALATVWTSFILACFASLDSSLLMCLACLGIC